MNKKVFQIIGGSLLVSAAMLAGLIWYATRVPPRGGDFNLMNQQGVWNFRQNAKDLNLFYVGYAKCPDVCPMTLTHVTDAFRSLTEAEKARVQMIFLSVDREHDTAESVQVYAAQFNEAFLGMTGTQEQIDHVLREVGASYIIEEDPKSYLGYSISHTDKVFFLDRKGIVIDEDPMVRSKDSILAKIRSHL